MSYKRQEKIKCQIWTEQDLKEKAKKQEDKWENVKTQNLRDLEEEEVMEDQEDAEDFQKMNKKEFKKDAKTMQKKKS